ncbi:hypothetical protein SDC9_197175 [bioreactor metagenome]|uniref:Uncharacterized protein n=1 Tax=bioreactor metagenome TaxID=1076179 RepID=A0A645IMK6_9ZZZZ
MFFQPGFVNGAVISIAREAVQLPDDDHLELLLGSILDHVLEARPVIRSGGLGPVYVLMNNGVPFTLCEGVAIPELPLNGLL